MTLITVISVCASAFLFGFLLGISSEPERDKKAVKKRAERTAAVDRIKKEYENFLNYDGSEQN